MKTYNAKFDYKVCPDAMNLVVAKLFGKEGIEMRPHEMRDLASDLIEAVATAEERMWHLNSVHEFTEEAITIYKSDRAGIERHLQYIEGVFSATRARFERLDLPIEILGEYENEANQKLRKLAVEFGEIEHEDEV